MRTLLILVFNLLSYQPLLVNASPFPWKKTCGMRNWVAEVEVTGFNDTSQIVMTEDTMVVEAKPPFRFRICGQTSDIKYL